MSKNDYQIKIDRAPGGTAAEVVLLPAGKTAPVRLQAQPGSLYTLTDRATDKAPQQIYARRQGKNLLLQLDERVPGEADLILENFYEGAPGTFVGQAEDGSMYRFIPNTAREVDQLGGLTDGAQASQVLGGAAYAGADASTALVAAAPMGVASAPLVAGGFVLGGPALAAGAALVGAAALGSGGGGGGGDGGSGGGTSGGGTTPIRSFTAAIAAGDDTGVSPTDGITYKTRPKLEGTAPVGGKIQVRLDSGELVDVPVDPNTGAWSWVPPADLTNARHEYLVRSIEGDKVSDKTFVLIIDTGKLTATLSSNFDTLNTEPIGAKDSKLNINESKNGVLMTIKLGEKPGRELTVNDLSLAGGSIKSGSFTKVSSTEYSVVCIPTADTTDNLMLKWTSVGQGLTDEAGNALDNASSQQLSLAYDTHAPAVTLSAGNAVISANAGQNVSMAWTSTDSGEVTGVKVTLLGQEAQKSGSPNPLILLEAGEGLRNLVNGYYTLTTTFKDAAGNDTKQQAVLKVDRQGLLPDAWVDGNGNQQLGSSNNDLFINRLGSQSFKGNGGADTFVWLKRDVGTAGSPDTDTITDFQLGGAGIGDKLDIKDLLGANIASVNLPKYVQVSTVDTNGDGLPDATRVAISSKGAFIDSTNVSAEADQVIVLQNLLATNLNALLPDNLIWSATGAPILG